MATAPSFFGPIVEKLAATGLMEQNNDHWRRVIIEKPFGHDLESAKALNQQLLKLATENQIYRIDHYLGKETVQNIMAFRFANGIFEPIWNRRYIDHVQISVAETVGVEGRGSYFEHAGSLRDMVPNHIMQLISLTAMEPPISFDANAVRDEQAKILHAIQPIDDEEVLSRAVRGQYGEGTMEGERVPAYRSEPDVAPDSRTETFVAMKLLIDNWRWADVPFYLRTGKRMPARNTHIVIQFRRAPFVLFRDTSVEHLMPNQLVLHIQPEEGISLQFAAKVPGPVMRLGTVDMNFEYQEYFGKQPSTGYERLLHDCMIGDQTLVSTGRHGGGGLERGQSGARFVEGTAAAKLSELRFRHVGTERGRRTVGARWPALEELREMILAGDIGGTNARLAYFQPQNGHLRLVSERVFPSREYSELGEIVSKFLSDSATRPEAACFGIAGPVHNGRVETSNLPWVIDQSRLAKQIQLPATLLINDLEANAWGIGALGAQDLVSLNQVVPSNGNQAVIAPGTGLGEAGLFWNGSQHQVFACEGGHADFAPQGDLQIELLRFLARRYGHVSYERVLSGPGLVNVYEFLREKGCGRRACRICRATFPGRCGGGDFPCRAERHESAGRAGAGSVDFGLRRGSGQSGAQDYGGRRHLSGRRNLAEDSSQAYGAAVYACVSGERQIAPASREHSGASHHQRQGRIARSGAVRGHEIQQRPGGRAVECASRVAPADDSAGSVSGGSGRSAARRYSCSRRARALHHCAFRRIDSQEYVHSDRGQCQCNFALGSNVLFLWR